MRTGPWFRVHVLSSLGLLCGPVIVQARQDTPHAATTDILLRADSAAVAQVVRDFHAALEAGDSAGALQLLQDDAIVLETGSVETKEQYRSGHLPADISYARAVRREAGPVRVVVSGDVAWATSTSTMRGTYRDREVNSQSAELMVLQRTASGWRIAAIHWSSRTLRTQ